MIITKDKTPFKVWQTLLNNLIVGDSITFTTEMQGIITLNITTIPLNKPDSVYVLQKGNTVEATVLKKDITAISGIMPLMFINPIDVPLLPSRHELYKEGQEISTVADVTKFLYHIMCTQELYDGFHPDTDFNDYEFIDEDKRVFTPEQTDRYNAVMAACFEVCEREKQDIYEIGLAIRAAYRMAIDWPLCNSHATPRRYEMTNHVPCEDNVVTVLQSMTKANQLTETIANEEDQVPYGNNNSSRLNAVISQLKQRYDITIKSTGRRYYIAEDKQLWAYASLVNVSGTTFGAKVNDLRNYIPEELIQLTQELTEIGNIAETLNKAISEKAGQLDKID